MFIIQTREQHACYYYAERATATDRTGLQRAESATASQDHSPFIICMTPPDVYVNMYKVSKAMGLWGVVRTPAVYWHRRTRTQQCHAVP
eukprot:608052-Prorocentrum_minimum.AAC.1